jgi:predicted nucleic acid-binding Zn ribbon protein
MRDELLNLIKTKGIHHIVVAKIRYIEILIFLQNETVFLDSINPTIGTRLHYFLNDVKQIKTCIECGKPLNTYFSTFCSKKCMDTSVFLNEQKRKTSLEKYGVDNYAKTTAFKEKYENHMRVEYGVSHYSKTKKFKEDFESTSQKKYGTSNPAKNEDIKQRQIETCNIRYGGNGPMSSVEIRNKSKETLKREYNVEHNTKIPGHFEKIKQTSVEKFGVEHCMHNIDIAEKCFKNAHKFKAYVFPSGKIVNVQGYENYIIDELLKIYDETDILVDNKEIESCVGKIQYLHENKLKRYYPDIYIKSENKIIEVKSTYTITQDTEKNEQKKIACENMGMKFEFKIYKK